VRLLEQPAPRNPSLTFYNVAPSDEEAALIACDVRGLSYIQAADKLHLSPDAIKLRKRKAYAKIADELNHAKDTPF